MVGNDIPKSDTSGKKLVYECIRMKRMNVVIMTIMFHRWTSIGGIAMLARLFLSLWNIHRSATVLRVAMNPIVNISRSYH